MEDKTGMTDPLKRYHPSGNGYMAACSDGDYVRVVDHNARIASLSAQVAAMREDRDNLRKFIDALIQDVCWGRGMPDDMDGGSVQDMAERMGVLVTVPHPLPCANELCGCEGEDVEYLYNTPWNTIAPLDTPTPDGTAK